MIFVTVGTHQQPFTRLINALDQLDPAELVVQYGPAPKAPRAALAVPFMPYDELARHISQATAVITHAGVGSILLALRAGHVPIAVPRLRRHGEHVDDHQAELTRAIGEQGIVEVVWDTRDLPGAVQRAEPPSPAAARAPGPLQAAVGAALLDRQ